MDFNVYTESIIEKLKETNFYSELEESELKDTLNKYLEDEYVKKIEMASFQYYLNKDKDAVERKEILDSIFLSVKHEMVTLVRELSKTELD